MSALPHIYTGIWTILDPWLSQYYLETWTPSSLLYCPSLPSMLNLTETCCEVEYNGMTCLYYSIIHRTLKTQIIFCLNLTFQDQLAKQFWSLIV